MTDGLLDHAKGNYKSEWDAPISNVEGLPPVPDYEEIMIWDKKPGARSGGDDDDMNGEDASIGDFTHPDFWESVDGGDLDAERSLGGVGATENTRPLGKPITEILKKI